MSTKVCIMGIQDIHNIKIPERANAPATELYIKIIAEDSNSLTTKPFVFILPGGPGANHSNYHDYACIQTSCNVVFHDPRGCGLSSKENPDFFTMDTYIDDIDVIRHQLQLPQIYIIGKSYGAMCALGYTLRYPNAVARLILAAGAPSYKFIDTARTNFMTRETTIQQQQLCDKLWDGNFSNDKELADYLQAMAPIYSYKKRHAIPINRSKPLFPHAHEPLNRGFSDFLHRFDFEHQLQNIHCKTLILVGDEDWITDKQYSQMMAEKIPNSQLIIFHESDHAMESDVPELFFNAIQTFLTS